MRKLDIALAAFALRASPPQEKKPERRLIPAVDDAEKAMLDRAALSHQHAAMIASLWPPARQCVIAPLYEALPAPAMFGMMYRVSWAPPGGEDARALQERLRAAFH